MPKICFLHTESNGSQYYKCNPDKKKLYKFTRLVFINYEIGNVINNNYVCEKKISRIVKPRCCYISEENSMTHGITQEHAIKDGFPIEDILSELKDNLQNINIMISFNTNIHYNTILAEAVRYNLPISFNKFINIDISTFNHTYQVDIKELANKLNINYEKEYNILTQSTELVRLIFLIYIINFLHLQININELQKKNHKILN
jgi:hypothetical protein